MDMLSSGENVNTFLKWARSSLFGCIVLCLLLFSLPIILVFSYESATHEGLYFAEFIYIAFVGTIAGVFGGIVFWFTNVKPMRKRLGLDSKQKR